MRRFVFVFDCLTMLGCEDLAAENLYGDWQPKAGMPQKLSVSLRFIEG